MFRRALVLLLLALGAAAAASPEVLRLDADSFEPAVASRPFVAVAFVAPWCAHCKRLEPEWRAAASKLAARGRNIALATLDATAGDANAALAARHDVRGFPSIRIFRDGDSRSAEEYVGPRAADGVVATLERLEAKAETFIHTIRDAEAFVNAKPVVVLGVFDGERDAPLARAFGAAARAFADDPDAPDDVSVPFGVVASAALVPETDAFMGDALNGDVLIYRAFETRVERFRFEDLADTKKSRDERVNALASFVSLRATPRVAALTRDPRSRSVLRRVFADPGPKVIGFADDESTRRDMAQTMARVAEEEEKEHISNADAFGAGEKDALTKKKAQTRARFVVGVAAENANAMRFFDVDPERLPAVVIHDTRTDARYVLHDASDADALAEWLAAFRAGTLAPTVRSAGEDDGATPPEAEAAPSAASAAILVAKGFRDAVAGAEAPAVTLIQFHAPWCGHCESFAPTYNAVAAAFRDDRDARVVTFDADANDVPDARFDVKGFPAVRLYRKADDSVHAYEGARTTKALIEFVRKHVGVGSGGDARRGERGDDGEL